MKRVGIILVACLLVVTGLLAQTEPPKPGPEVKKLDVLAGAWTLEGDVKPGPMGQGGKMTESQKCEWMEGGYFLVCHVDLGRVHGREGSPGRQYLDLDQRREDGRQNGQGTIHHEDDLLCVVRLYV